mmetsp:Transcript_19666/g.28998  ORF Transcript_19666/g.28998 Transcript_19666/m.28998 type:complete len:134 (+) Transcript_19666:187-588(+)
MQCSERNLFCSGSEVWPLSFFIGDAESAKEESNCILSQGSEDSSLCSRCAITFFDRVSFKFDQRPKKRQGSALEGISESRRRHSSKPPCHPYSRRPSTCMTNVEILRIITILHFYEAYNNNPQSTQIYLFQSG